MEMFKKEDIKVGYVLEVWDDDKGRTGLVKVGLDKNGKLGVSGEITFFPFECFNENLEYAGTTVLAIHSRAFNKHEWKLDTEGRELLWVRQKPKQMTLGQICEELGYEVEIIDE